MKNIFEKDVSNEVVGRINKLTPSTKAVWGKMSVSQMLAHCNVQYEIIYENQRFPKPNPFVRFLLKTFVKNKVVGPKPFPKNGRTSPYFIIDGDKDFEAEKSRLTDYIQKTQVLGVEHLLHRDTKSFGKLTKEQWSALFYKHLDHHLAQFDV
jgi:hypothetical protein